MKQKSNSKSETSRVLLRPASETQQLIETCEQQADQHSVDATVVAPISLPRNDPSRLNDLDQHGASVISPDISCAETNDVSLTQVPEAAAKTSAVRTSAEGNDKIAVERHLNAQDPKVRGAIYFLLSQSKTISLLLGLTIALVATFIAVNDRSGKEQLFRKYIGDAELQEYDGRYDRAALVWHSAIKLGTSLGDKAKLVADLHVRAAMAEAETSGQDTATENNHIHDQKIRLSSYYKKPLAVNVISDLIPLYHEVIYYSHSEPAYFKFDQQMLDWAMTWQSTDPSNFKDRLNAGDLAFFDHDYHGAIVEYLRCLGLKNDQRVRDKLINSLQLARKADFGPVEPLSEYIILLEKSLKLNQQAFGKNHHRVHSALFDLGIANWSTNHLKEAEYELRSIKLDKNDVSPSPSDVAYALADVYAKEGKCDEAVAQYRASLALESEYERRLPPKGVRDRIAYAYICAGRFRESMQTVKQSPIEQAPSLTGSTDGFVRESGPFIE
jgi:tetratricopeptide (TPR) repeat protein